MPISIYIYLFRDKTLRKVNSHRNRMQLPLYTLIRFYFRSTGTQHLACWLGNKFPIFSVKTCSEKIHKLHDNTWSVLLDVLEWMRLCKLIWEHEHRSLDYDELIAADINLLLGEGECTQALDRYSLGGGGGRGEGGRRWEKGGGISEDKNSMCKPKASFNIWGSLLRRSRSQVHLLLKHLVLNESWGCLPNIENIWKGKNGQITARKSLLASFYC